MTAIIDFNAGGTFTNNYDSFWTATIKNYSPQLFKSFLEDRPSVRMLMDNFGHQDSGGGRVWQGSVEYGRSQTVQFFTGADVFSQNVSQVALPVMYQWAYVGGSVSMTKTEAIENRSQAALFNLMEARLRQVTRTINLVLGQENFSDGTNYPGKTIIGLAAAVSTTPSVDPASGPLGGISASNTFWRNNAVASLGSFAVNGVNGSTQDLFFHTYNLCSDGSSDKPTNIISDQLTYQYYNRTLLQETRYVDPFNSKTGDLSFSALRYQDLPWEWDRQCPTGTAYFLNRRYIYYMLDPAMMFDWSKPLSAPDQLAFTRIVACRLAMVTVSRMFMAVISGITA